MTFLLSFWRSRALATIISLYLLIGAGWAILIPPFEKPDEIGHVAFIQLVALSGEWPDLRHPQTPLVGWEAHQPPLYYLVGAATYRTVRALGISATDLNVWLNRANPNFFWKRPPRENNFFYQAGTFFRPDAAFPYDLMALRLMTLALGAVTVFFCYKAALLAFRHDSQLALVTTALVAFLPQFTFITTTVSNDSLAIAFGAIALYLLARLRVAPECARRRDCVALGVVLGLGVLTKLTAVSLVPLALLAIWQIEAAAKQRVRYLLWIGLVSSLVTAGWFARNELVYGDLLGRYFIIDPVGFASELDRKSLFSPYFGAPFWGRLGQSLVGEFGFMHIAMPDWFYRLWLGVGLISAVGCVTFAIQRHREPRSVAVRVDTGAWLLMSCAVLLAVAALIQFNLTTSQPQGRLVAHVLPALAIVLVAGLLESYVMTKRLVRRLSPGLQGVQRPWSVPAATLGIGAVLVGLNLWALCDVVLPAYAAP